MFCNNEPWTSKSSRCCRWSRPDSIRWGGLDRPVLPAYRISVSLKALLYPLVLSLGRIETTEPLRSNGVFHYLVGLPGYPESSSLRRPQGWPEARRFVVIRRPMPEEPSAQLRLFRLFQMGGYSSQVFVTNLSLAPLHLWCFYNQRARAELIRELKDAYALGKIPTKEFLANEAFFQIVLLAYNRLNWFKRLYAPAHLERATLHRLRQRLFLVPSQLVRPGGIPNLGIAPSYPCVADFLETLRRIRRLRSPFRVV